MDEVILWNSLECCEKYSKYRPRYERVVLPWIMDFYRSCQPAHLKDTIRLAVDVGCGPGHMSSALSGECQRVLGIDISEKLLTIAHRECSASNVKFICASALDLRKHCDSHTADLVVASNMAHDVDVPELYSEMQRITRPGGIVALVGYLVEGFRDLNGDQHLTSFRDFYDNQVEVHRKMTDHLLSRYKTLKVPFSNVLHKEGTMDTWTDRYGVQMILEGNPDPWKGGQDAADRFLDDLPADGLVKLITSVFGLFVQL